MASLWVSGSREIVCSSSLVLVSAVNLGSICRRTSSIIAIIRWLQSCRIVVIPLVCPGCNIACTCSCSSGIHAMNFTASGAGVWIVANHSMIEWLMALYRTILPLCNMQHLQICFCGHHAMKGLPWLAQQLHSTHVVFLKWLIADERGHHSSRAVSRSCALLHA